jgi:hypothetical protein
MKRISPNHPSLRDRKDAVGQRRWKDYDQRVRKARRRNLIASLALLTVASLTDNFWYVLLASGLVLLTGLPYMMAQREE